MSEVPRQDGEPAVEAPSRTALDHLAYVLSLPERAVRGGSGLIGGLVRESAELLVPQSFQSSRTYTAMVRQMLDFMVHDVGGVPTGDVPSSTANVDNYVARKAVGNFLDMASLATLHLSPLVILAAVSDIAYGSQSYLKELADELKRQGVIDRESHIDHVSDLLGAVSHASATTSAAFDTPPLSFEGLKQTIAETTAAIASGGKQTVPSQAEVDQMWQQMRDIADREGVDMLAVGGATTMQSMGKFATLTRGALSTAAVAGKLFDRHVLDHYAQALAEIQRKGFYQTVAESSGPYIEAVWDNFHTSRSTITEDLLSGKLIGNGWQTLRSWLSPSGTPRDEDKQAGSDQPAAPETS
jgi:nucleotide-binding universal stress UspA family protein